MDSNGLLVAWMVGALMGVAMHCHRLYLLAVFSYSVVLVVLNQAGIAGGIAQELLVTLAFVIASFGVFLGTLALWKGKRE